MESLVDSLIEEYNAKRTSEKHPAPNIRFEIAKLDRSLSKVSEMQFALMFWDRVQEYQIRNSMILLSEGSFRNQQFQYILNEMEDRYRLNGTKVIVCYQKIDRSRIMLFNENEQFIMSLNRSAAVKPTRTERTERIVKQSVSLSKPIQISVTTHSVKKANTEIPKQNQLYKQPATLDVILLKSKGYE